MRTTPETAQGSAWVRIDRNLAEFWPALKVYIHGICKQRIPPNTSLSSLCYHLWQPPPSSDIYLAGVPAHNQAIGQARADIPATL